MPKHADIAQPKSRLICMTTLACTLTLLNSQATAFAPGNGAHEYPFSKSHIEITEESLLLVYKYLGITTLTSSMKSAQTEFTEANIDVDRDQFMSAPHFDGENFIGGQQYINRMINSALIKIKSGDFSGARDRVGRALHTVQDFYAHSNWVELGNKLPSSELGRPGFISNVSPPTDAACAPQTTKEASVCNIDNLITTMLTSGYFGGDDRKISDGGNVKKCRHGGGFDKGKDSEGNSSASNSPEENSNTSFILSGINKDSSVCLNGERLTDSPHSNFNKIATEVAVKATVQLFDDLKKKMTDREFKSLLGFGTSLGFAIDTTGSMGPIISGVQSQVISIINQRLGTSEEPSKYILSPFNDPSVGPLTITTDPNTFKSAINSLSAAGGGDCPEYSMAGLYKAVDQSDNGGTIFLYTDASAKDKTLKDDVNILAFQKNVKVIMALFGSCSPYDPAYFSIANSSGGQVLILSAFEANTVTQLSNILAKSNTVDVDSRQGIVSGTNVTIPFFVDSTMTKLSVLFSNIDNTTLSLIGPDGRVVSRTTANVTTLTLSKGIAYSITAPSIGEWKAVIEGSGQYSLLINAESPLSFDKFSFVEKGGRPGHQGYYNISGFPKIGSVAKALARVSGATQPLSFEFRDLNGYTIAPISLMDTDVDENYITGDVTIPSSSFRVFAFGTDANGNKFQRLIATTIFPQSFSVSSPAAVDLGQGQTTTYIFQVHNDGVPGSFSFTAHDTEGFVTSVSPSSASISTGQNILVTVKLTVGSTVPVGTRDTLTMLATSMADPDASNFSTLTSAVTDPKVIGDVNNDRAVDCNDLNLIKASFGSRTGSKSFNPDVDVDNNGIIDIRDLSFVSKRLPANTACN